MIGGIPVGLFLSGCDSGIHGLCGGCVASTKINMYKNVW